MPNDTDQLFAASFNSVSIYHQVRQTFVNFTYVAARDFDFEILKLECTFANQVVAMDSFCFYVWLPNTSTADKSGKDR